MACAVVLRLSGDGEHVRGCHTPYKTTTRWALVSVVWTSPRPVWGSPPLQLALLAAPNRHRHLSQRRWPGVSSGPLWAVILPYPATWATGPFQRLQHVHGMYHYHDHYPPIPPRTSRSTPPLQLNSENWSTSQIATQALLVCFLLPLQHNII